ncbi:MAG: TetR/AcrR family transcriptional regulator [Lachnospiraceae bacterium]|nr:TetR/AcrR family transcriptional regulator [Lachnospiraceae bacterium]
MREKVMLGALEVVKQKGVKFTMDDVARNLGMSKKTIYVVFRDKKELLMAMIDYLFDRIKDSENEIINDDSLSLEEKIRGILGVIPDGYKELNFSQVYSLKSRYPEIYELAQKRIESDWGMTFDLLKKGVEEGILRDVDFGIFKLAFEASVERLFMTDEIEEMGIDYFEALEKLVNIMIDGILAR